MRSVDFVILLRISLFFNFYSFNENVWATINCIGIRLHAPNGCCSLSTAILYLPSGLNPFNLVLSQMPIQGNNCSVNCISFAAAADASASSPAAQADKYSLSFVVLLLLLPLPSKLINRIIVALSFVMR